VNVPFVDDLLARMTLAEKLGQLCQVQPDGSDLDERIRAGGVGALINVVGNDAYRYQSVAVEQSRLKIPLLIARDVIHGFHTVFPIPLAQAATFDPRGVRAAAELAADEAGAAGVNWTLSPMVDVSRDPRWGRIAEGFGEDTLLSAQLGCAMVEGYQSRGLAACAKHFVGYGAAEGGRDYTHVAIPPRQMRDVYLPPFEAAVKAGVMTVMSGFHEIDGIPASGHAELLRGVLKTEWGFDGLVVSDWNSVGEMVMHGFAAGASDSARKAVDAGVDMEMAGSSYIDHLPELIERGEVPMTRIDDAVRRVLGVKHRLGLFDAPYGRPRQPESRGRTEYLARQLARRSCVLLKNDAVLPLGENLKRVAVIGPLADAAADQLGCWVFDADPARTRTVLAGIRERLGDPRVAFARGLEHCRSDSDRDFAEAIEVARSADAVVLCIGEDAGLSGEAHSRAFIGLPGAQQRLLDALAATGVPVVAVVMAGRPLTLAAVAERASAVLLAWHPGSMGGPAIADLLFGESPSGRLPVSLPRSVGQLPLYYNHKNTGRPPPADAPGIPSGTPLDPSGFFAAYMDEDHRPLFAFGYGLSYTRFEYSDLRLSASVVALGESLQATVTIRNAGSRTGTELVQLYVRDLVGSVTRPVKELKQYRHVVLEAGESRDVVFSLHTDELAFYGADNRRGVECGEFRLWVAPSATGGLEAAFEVVPEAT